MNTMPIVSPAVSPFARLAEPKLHADELTAAATLRSVRTIPGGYPNVHAQEQERDLCWSSDYAISHPVLLSSLPTK